MQTARRWKLDVGGPVRQGAERARFGARWHASAGLPPGSHVLGRRGRVGRRRLLLEQLAARRREQSHPRQRRRGHRDQLGRCAATPRPAALPPLPPLSLPPPPVPPPRCYTTYRPPNSQPTARSAQVAPSRSPRTLSSRMPRRPCSSRPRRRSRRRCSATTLTGTRRAPSTASTRWCTPPPRAPSPPSGPSGPSGPHARRARRRPARPGRAASPAAAATTTTCRRPSFPSEVDLPCASSL